MPKLNPKARAAAILVLCVAIFTAVTLIYAVAVNREEKPVFQAGDISIQSAQELPETDEATLLDVQSETFLSMGGHGKTATFTAVKELVSAIEKLEPNIASAYVTLGKGMEKNTGAILFTSDLLVSPGICYAACALQGEGGAVDIYVGTGELGPAAELDQPADENQKTWGILYLDKETLSTANGIHIYVLTEAPST